MTERNFIKRTAENSGYTIQEITLILNAVETQLKQDMVNGVDKVKLLDLVFFTKQFAPKQMNVTVAPGQRGVITSKGYTHLRCWDGADWKEILNSDEYKGKDFFAIPDEDEL